MKRKTKYLLLIFAVLPISIGIVVWAMYFRLPSTYSAESIVGQVVDKETGQALEEAIVIALWELERGFGLEGGILAGHMHVEEVLTDEHGYYSIAAWGPKRRPDKTWMTHNSPKLVVFKEGYDYFVGGNYKWSRADEGQYKRRVLQFSDWNRETIRLGKFEGDLEGYANQLESLQRTGLRSFYEYGSCKWITITNFIMTMGKYRKLFEQKGIKSYLPSLNGLIKRDTGRCKLINGLLRK